MTASLFAAVAARLPADRSRPVLETPEGHVLTWGELDTETARLANTLTGLGLTEGDRVAVRAEKSPRQLMLYLACLRAGLVYLPMNTAYHRDEVDYLVGNAEPGLIVCDPAAEDEVRDIASSHGGAPVLTLDPQGDGTLWARAADASPVFAAVERASDDLAVILYTSGTTGRPKGAMLSHGNLRSNAEALIATWGFTADDVLLHALPLFHAHGLFVACHCALLSGARMIWLNKFTAEAAIAQIPRATVFMGVPTLYTRLLAGPRLTRDLCRSMRVFISGSAPLLAETWRAFEDRTGHGIVERYGMTETGMNTSNPLDGERRAGSVGPPLPGVEVRIVDEDGATLGRDTMGDVQVRGPNVFAGYWRMPEKTAEDFTADGWLRTGDIGLIDADGYVHLVGRAKDLIITGGYNVYPKEVETVIDRIDGVEESAVIGVSDPDFGEAVTAVVVPRGDPAAVTEDAVIATVKAAIANYKVPKRVHVVDALPRNAMGKVQKNVLRDRFGK